MNECLLDRWRFRLTVLLKEVLVADWNLSVFKKAGEQQEDYLTNSWIERKQQATFNLPICCKSKPAFSVEKIPSLEINMMEIRVFFISLVSAINKFLE